MISKADLFARALEQPLARRAEFVDRASRRHPELRDEVLSLLDAHDGLGDFLDTDSSSVESAAEVAQPTRDAVPGHELVRKLGEGGFGTVHLARELGTLRRDVAIKFLKRDRLSTDALDRFDAERQFLAGLQHDGIARIYAAGTTSAGCPYYTMEWVDGPPLDRHCEEQRLTVAERVALLLHVCRAVGYAHQRGVIHGDLKPHNILVRRGEHECAASPKVIDFGIARTLGEVPRGRGSTAGTPRYMSPEQLAGGPADTRCDVFALGVLLHDLLAGGAQKTASRDRQGTLNLRDVAPDARLAEARRSSPRRLRRQLRGDLDHIVVNATHADPDQRYATVRELILDLEAWRAKRPLPSRPRTPGYLLRRFLDRHLPIASLVLAAAFTAARIGPHGA